MPPGTQETICPEFGFKFTAKCSNKNCLFWNESHGNGSFNCLKLDSDVKTALDLVTAKNSPLLSRLSKSEDPSIQLESSKKLLHFAFVFSLNIQKFENLDYPLCKCGARLNSCHGDVPCEKRQQWLGWLMKMYAPIVALNSALTQREVYHLLIASILHYRKTMKFPAFLEEALPELMISKRML